MNRLYKNFINAIRFAHLHLFAIGFTVFRSFSRRIWLFNLDCHISVIADLKQGFRKFPKVSIVSWNLSGHNFVFRRFFKFSDPVLHMGKKQWRDLTPERKAKFLKVYGRFLSGFDGFIATYPLAFLEMFVKFEKPLLGVVAIRYEHPFTSRPTQWEGFTSQLRMLTESGQLTIAANNEGDADYFSAFVGRDIPVVPSLCDYLPSLLEKPDETEPRPFPIFAKSDELTQLIRTSLGAPWQGKKEALGADHNADKLASCGAIVYIPYNISTMFLFEMATLGIPVLIPSKGFMMDLRASFDGVLSEITFMEMAGVNPPRSLANDCPGADAGSDSYVDWWLERADFYNHELMPNVLQFSSFDDAIFATDFAQFRTTLVSTVLARNALLAQRRDDFLGSFLQKVMAIKART